MNHDTSRKLPATALVALAVAATGTATDAGAFEYTLSGQVNRLVTSIDDGTQSRLFNADNVNSRTRFRFTGTEEFSTGPEGRHQLGGEIHVEPLERDQHDQP